MVIGNSAIQASSQSYNTSLSSNNKIIANKLKSSQQNITDGDDITKIKTLLPYLLIKRAYSKLKNSSRKNDKYDKDKKSAKHRGHPRSNSAINDRLMSQLCSNSGSSLCQLVSN